jgi:hypothetical protein
MTAFQIIALSGIAIICSALVAGIVRRRLSWASGLSWLVLWAVAGIAIARPELTVVIAQALGIRRGADLVMYSGVLASLVGFFAVFVRIRRLEGTITEVVRQIAIDRAAYPPGRQDTVGPNDGE